MINHKNGALEDLGAIIGFESTSRLCALLGGGSYWIPVEADTANPIARIVGEAKMRRLVAEFGGQTIFIPVNDEFERMRVLRQVVKLVQNGFSATAIAELTMLTERQINRYRVQAEELGLLPMVMGPERRATPESAS
jgi:hypothetical protein